MRVTILGCGGSGGVPMIGHDWGDCDPANPKNRRTRTSILVEEGDTRLLIDTSPDLREQLLRAQVQSLTAVLYTHAHADHVHGIDDLRAINWRMKAPLDVYSDAVTIEKITRRFDYIFRPLHQNEAAYYKPALVPHVLDGPLTIGPLTINAFEQDHTYMKSLGFRIGAFAYSTDCKQLPEAAFEALQGIDVWVVDCVSYREHPTHSHLQQTLMWIERVKPKKAFLTHMGTRLDYDTLCRELPPHIRPSYDGLEIVLS